MVKHNKIFNSILIIMTLLLSFIPSFSVAAKTVKDLRNELQKLEDDAKDVNNKIIYTEQEISKAKSNITQLYKDIDRLVAEMEATTKKINELNDSIKEKNDEAKELISFIQISNSDSVYMEYIAGAKTMTDFIYRLSVSQQLLDHNKKLIEEMNQMIVESNAKKVSLKQQEEESKRKQQELAKNVQVLGSEKEQLYEFDMSLEEEIKLARDVLDMYTKAGCKDTDDISVCANKYLPPDTSFWRPLGRGVLFCKFNSFINSDASRYILAIKYLIQSKP
jgi:peptidoglycan hydrolase CwlO-like protein